MSVKFDGEGYGVHGYICRCREPWLDWIYMLWAQFGWNSQVYIYIKTHRWRKHDYRWREQICWWVEPEGTINYVVAIGQCIVVHFTRILSSRLFLSLKTYCYMHWMVRCDQRNGQIHWIYNGFKGFKPISKLSISYPVVFMYLPLVCALSCICPHRWCMFWVHYCCSLFPTKTWYLYAGPGSLIDPLYIHPAFMLCEAY